jgi:hypothetical protein
MSNLDLQQQDEALSREEELYQLLNQVKSANNPTELQLAHQKAAVLYPQAALEIQQKHAEKVPGYIDDYNTQVQALASARDQQQDNTNLLNTMSQAAALMGGTKAVNFSQPSDEDYQAKKQALYAGLQAKLKSPYIPRMPGVGSMAAGAKPTNPLDDEYKKALTARAKAQTDQVGKPKSQDEHRILERLGRDYDKQTEKLRDRAAQTETLKTLLVENTPQSIEAAKTVMARLSGEVGALSNQDREAYAGSKAYMDQLSQFFNTKIAAEGFTSENKQAFEGIMAAFEKSIEDGHAKALAKFEGRGQALKLAPGATTEYITGSKASAPVQSTAPVVQETAPATVRIRQISSGVEKTLPADQAVKFLADPTKYEKVK